MKYGIVIYEMTVLFSSHRNRENDDTVQRKQTVQYRHFSFASFCPGQKYL